MLIMFYDFQRLDETQNAVFTVESIMACQLVGDKLQKVLFDWNSTLAGQGDPVPNVFLMPLRLRQLRKRPQPKGGNAQYDRALPGTFEYPYICL